MRCGVQPCENHAMVKLMDGRPLCAAHYAAQFPEGGGFGKVLDREQWEAWTCRLAANAHAASCAKITTKAETE